MEKDQGFLTNFNFPVKKVRGGNQNNIFGLKRKGNTEVVEPQNPQLCETPSIEQKNENPYQQVTPQGKARLSNKLNKILVSNSSGGINPKSADTVIGTDNEKPESNSLSFPESFSIPKPQTDPKEKETYVTDDESEEECAKTQESLTPKKRVIYTDEYREQSESDSEEVIPVYDSEEEVSMNLMQPAVDSKSFYNCSESSTSVSHFFNNIPSLDSRMAVQHSDIRQFKAEDVHRDKPPIAMIRESFGDENDSMLSNDRDRAARARDESSLEDIEIGPTDESNNNVEDDVVDLTLNESSSPQPRVIPTKSSEVIASSNTPHTIKAKVSTTPRSGKKNVTNINIKFDLKISIRDGSDSDTTSSSSSTKSSPRRLTETTSNTRTNKHAGTPNLMLPMLKDSEEPKTPQKPEAVIDEDLQKMLNAVYGEAWKTPDLLRSCKSKRVRENLRKSLHANNFESFVRNLPDLESTRVSDKEEFRKPVAPVSAKKTASVKKQKRTKSSTESESDEYLTPKSQKSQTTSKPTPKYLEICDPDTSSSDESDEEFNPNDTWNASSDSEYDSESERIKKRNIVRQSVRVEELTFFKDESIVEQKKIEQLLEKYEFTQPAQIGDSAKKSKRKLFTHTHFEDDEIEVPKVPENKENEIPRVKEFKKPEVASPVIRKTPKSTPKSLPPRFGPHSFLKSLDAEANRTLCDPDALFYRNNYKTKKQELAEKLFKLYNEKVFNSKLINVPMKWNKKLLNTAGRCNNSRRTGIRQSSLELSDKVLTSADRLRCTLIHEMCHAAAWMLDGENGHGVVWKRWASRANFAFPELPKITVCHNYVIEYKYTYLCVNCKAQSKTHSKSKKVELIQCSICKGSIKLFANKRNAAGELEMIPIEKKEVTGFAKFVKLKFKEVKRPNMTHKEVMQVLSTQFQSLTVEEKSNL